jgi:hypothetical protein
MCSGALEVEQVVSVGRRPEGAAVMQFRMRCRTAMKLGRKSRKAGVRIARKFGGDRTTGSYRADIVTGPFCTARTAVVRIVDRVGGRRPTLTKLASGRAMGCLHAHRKFRDDPTTGRYPAGLARRPAHSGQWARWQLRTPGTSELSGHDGTAAPVRILSPQPGPPSYA